MVNDNGEIKIIFSTKGRTYEVISTAYGQNRSVWSAMDTIKNNIGEQKTMARSEWYKYFNKLNNGTKRKSKSN